MDKEKAIREIADKVSKAEALIQEAEVIAEEAGVEFDFSPAYGMGGTYIPKALTGVYVQEGWNPSSQSC